VQKVRGRIGLKQPLTTLVCLLIQMKYLDIEMLDLLSQWSDVFVLSYQPYSKLS
jgi:hypothetical protein